MAIWTYASYMARLRHESNHATNPKAIARLRVTLKAVEGFLTETWTDPDVDGWVELLRSYEWAATKAGLRHG
jgi:hypothetical protein